MSRAFVNEDGPDGPAPRFQLPDRDDPGFPRAAAEALLEAADRGETSAAEEATGYAFGSAALVADMQAILHEARARHQDRREQLAERFLRRAGVEVAE